ncbi:MAG TPA: hypothetical protein VFE47_00775 [Tepidisphaeraceae bacterium]|jgi:hypothetical protein|nr:hypothetical protein [Tepidisphaeraceae bacterium]
MMRTSLKKSAILSLVALSAVSSLLSGCKKPSEMADEAVAVDLQKAEDTYPDHRDASAALPIISKSITTANATDSEKSLANMAAGQSEVLAADAVFHKIDAAQNHLERILGRVAAMTTDLQTNDLILGSLEAREPTKSLAEIAKGTNAAKVGQQGVWFAAPAAASPIPALAGIDKTIADLNAAADALKTSHADLEKQRNDALAQAEKLSAQSEQSKGKASLDLYVQAVNLRKSAGNLSIKMTDLDSQLLANGRELAVAKAQQMQLQSALTKFDEAGKAVSASWDGVKKQIDEVVAKSKSIVEQAAPPEPVAATPTTPVAAPAPVAAPQTPGAAASAKPPAKLSEPPEAGVYSLNDAADQVAKLSAELTKLRKEAKDHLAKADGYFAEAAKLNKNVVAVYKNLIATVNDSPSKPAWQWSIELHNDFDPTLQRAQVAQRLARLYADDVYYTTSMQSIEQAAQSALAPADAAVKAALDEGKIEFPKALDPSALPAGIEASKAAAVAAFKQSDEYLDTLFDLHPVAADHSPTLKESDDYLDGIIKKTDSTESGRALLEAAKITKMINLYARYAYATAMKDEHADSLKKDAAKLANALTQAPNVELPQPLPADIAPQPDSKLTSALPTTNTALTQPSDTTQPTTAPTTQESPATAPATNPAAPDASVPATPPATSPAAAPNATPAAPATPPTSATPPAAPDATPAPTTPAPPAVPAK